MLVHRRQVLLAIILAATAACDKARDIVDGDRTAAAPVASRAAGTDLSAHPELLFHVFGETSDPRMVPIAVISDGALHPIVLDAQGWHRLDAAYLREGATYTLYHDGAADGTVRVKRGMWESGRLPLYSLPGCTTLTPVASIELQRTTERSEFTLQDLASTLPALKPHTGPVLPQDQLERIARAMALEAAPDAGIDPHRLDSLTVHAVSIATGVSRWPTIVATFIDAAAENTANPAGHTTHLFIVADADSGGRYRATYVHAANGPLASAEFRRYYDHLDVSGDGVDEILLEGWRYGGDSYLAALQWRDGRWGEVFRGQSNWCLDDRPPR